MFFCAIASKFKEIRKTDKVIRRRICANKKVLEDNVQLTLTGNLLVTNALKIVNTLDGDKWPVYRVLDIHGKFLSGDGVDIVDRVVAETMYKIMIKTQATDDIFYNAQRQGRISFYMQNSGEEASHVGSAAALKDKDIIFAQYRELGVLFYRGFTLQQAADQCFSNEGDLGKGRQMPVHYGCAALKYVV